MPPSLTDTLCTQCGLCCDGSLFADVELTGPGESTGLEILGLEIDDDDTDGGLLLLPCGALRGTRCGIYAHRPRTCRTFECKLLQDVRRGAVGVGQAGEHIQAARKLIERVGQLLVQLGERDTHLPLIERCADALAGDAAATPQVKRKRAQLAAAMSAGENVIQTTFLGRGRERGATDRP